MNTITATPQVPTYTKRAADGIWSLVVACPFCGDAHQHGGGSDVEPDLGLCLSHCLDGDLVDGYVLIAGPAGMVRPRRTPRAARWPR